MPKCQKPSVESREEEGEIERVAESREEDIEGSERTQREAQVPEEEPCNENADAAEAAERENVSLPEPGLRPLHLYLVGI